MESFESQERLGEETIMSDKMNLEEAEGLFERLTGAFANKHELSPNEQESLDAEIARLSQIEQDFILNGREVPHELKEILNKLTQLNEKINPLSIERD